MLWLKGCPRCHGDLLETTDVDDSYVACIQCGKELTAEQEAALPRPGRPTARRRLTPRPGRSAA